MASNASGAKAPSNTSLEEQNETPRPNSQQARGDEQQTESGQKFSHPGARMIAQQAADGDGPYRCRKCGDAVLTVSVVQCPGCEDNHPWFSSAQDDEPA